MAVIHEIQKTIWLETPKGRAIAHFLIDNGQECELEWVVFQQDGSIWSWSQSDVRACKNTTLGRDGTSSVEK